jgi:hypothetical protein
VRKHIEFILETLAVIVLALFAWAVVVALWEFFPDVR